jgi:hypothetical protein
MNVKRKYSFRNEEAYELFSVRLGPTLPSLGGKLESGKF